MIRKLFERLPLLFLVGAPLAGLFWFLAPYDFEASSGPFRIVLYAFYASSVTAITFTYFRFIRNAEGKVAAWLVIAFYVEAFFNLTLLGILTLLVVRYLHPGGYGFEATLAFRAIYGLIGASATATFIGAAAALVGYRRGLLGRRIEPFPFGRKEGP